MINSAHQFESHPNQVPQAGHPMIFVGCMAYQTNSVSGTFNPTIHMELLTPVAEVSLTPFQAVPKIPQFCAGEAL